MRNLLQSLFRLPRRQKRTIQLMVDCVLIAASFLLAMLLRLESWTPLSEASTWLALLVLIPLSLAIYVRLGFYRAVIRYLGPKAIRAVVVGVVVSALSLPLVSYLFALGIPRSVPFIYAMLALLTIGGVRFGLRAIYLRSQIRHKPRVVIYGAGSAGRQLAASLTHGQEYLPIAFVDDALSLQNTYIEGLKVYPPRQLGYLADTYGAERVLLAVPSASRARRREILAELEPQGFPVQTIPGVVDMVTGRARISEVRDVAVEDLLGRDPVPPNPTLMDANIRGKVVLVTGAGGSIGSELCRQILRHGPGRLLLLDLSEFALYRIEQDLLRIAAEEGLEVRVEALMGSVQHRQRLTTVMKAYEVQTVYHAAAYKHVPMVEHNVVEGVQNNVFGTLSAARSAIDAGVETFVLVSTDKAVRPTNVMGTTKRLAELVCQAFARQQSATRFCMVRFGNVLGSSGSVVPLFRQQIQAGGPITVTHPDITRFFMTIPEAAQLVIQAGAMARGGDVFVLDMGEPVRIADLARQMVRLSGLKVRDERNPDGDIAIAYSGLRPGEKLYEELLVGDDVAATSHPRIMTAQEVFWEWPRLENFLDRLFEACRNFHHDGIRRLLLEAPTAYRPEGGIVDLVWLEKRRREALEPVSSAAVTPLRPVLERHK
ncbi:polysaccharide biosynthesis protein [Billgrantia desiderata]|uniref:polysaccharide biosynthesis protein n=1 Tax=Billgrantia desiderata TaxID=52021 RepID=UPI00089EA405|nr:nucleoside-diphosphate sugar epimerase/dehydratase [Halomonas desiderata]MCE8014052.1 polysaccharide biosynthesis protein [Halomonas desiderata]SEF45915.1 NDP-sugar epimerase, includes UDP-GlcNAc-inverting 4,6-dehydratase FlaA1 and capsular polysaccharide biosynthesis protein EpsC [Halomonas desiderata]